jgi:hypothetical protein
MIHCDGRAVVERRCGSIFGVAESSGIERWADIERHPSFVTYLHCQMPNAEGLAGRGATDDLFNG